MSKYVSDLIIDTLEAVGVKRIYGIVGDSLNGITDALSKKNTMSLIHTRHEESAAFAAGAEGSLTGELSVCAGSCGPGNLHLINGLYECQRNRSPVLAIAAHIPSEEIGSGYFQETHPQYIFQECSVFCELVSHPDQMPRMLNMAIQAAINHKGVAVLVISGDICLKKSKYSQKVSNFQHPNPVIVPNANDLKKMAILLNAGKNITILGGAGCQGAHTELLKLAETLQAPVVHALRGKEFIEYDNPYDVGMTGLIGFSSGYYAMEACDTLLILGSSFPYRQFYPTSAKIIQLDIDGAQLGKRCPLAFGLIGETKPTIQALLPLLESKTNNKHLTKARAHYQKARAKLDKLALPSSKSELIHPQQLVKFISNKACEDAIFTCDVGTPVIWCARFLKMNGKRRLIGSFNHGSMANALSQSLGAMASHPNKQVISICGDGGLSMLMGELITLTQMRLPVKVVVINNGTLGFVELEMKASGYLENGTELINPNFAAMANAMGIHALRVEKYSELESAVENILAHDGPALLDVKTNRLELSMPPSITKEQVLGFTLYMSKMVLSGRGDEAYHLTKSNLWR